MRSLPPCAPGSSVGHTTSRCMAWTPGTCQCSDPCGGACSCRMTLRRKPRQWLALDDDLEDWPESSRQNLVACDGFTGLSSPEVQCELREKLQRCQAALTAHSTFLCPAADGQWQLLTRLGCVFPWVVAPPIGLGHAASSLGRTQNLETLVPMWFAAR